MPIYLGGSRIRNMLKLFTDAYIEEALEDIIEGTLPDDGSTVNPTPGSSTGSSSIKDYENINRTISNINQVIGDSSLSITNNSISELNDTLIDAKAVLEDIATDLVGVNSLELFEHDRQIQ